MKIIKPKLNIKEDTSNPVTYTIVPKNQDSQNRTPNDQITALKGKVSDNDDIVVSPQAVNEESNTTNDPYINYFSKLMDDYGGKKYGLTGSSRKELADLVKQNIPFHSMDGLIKLFNDPKFHNEEFVNYIIPSLKIIFKHGDPKRGEMRLVDEKDVEKLKQFANTVDVKFGDMRFTDKIDSFLNAQQRYGVDKPPKQTLNKVSNISSDLAEKDVNTLLQSEINRLNNGGEPNKNATQRVLELMSINKINPQGLKRNNPDKVAYLKLQDTLSNPNLSPEKKTAIQKALKSLEKNNIQASKDELQGEDKVNANLLLQYAALTDNIDLVERSFELEKREITANTQQRVGGGRFGTRLSKELFNNPNITDRIKEKLRQKGLKENKIIIITNNQIKILKEHFNKMNEAIWDKLGLKPSQYHKIGSKWKYKDGVNIYTITGFRNGFHEVEFRINNEPQIYTMPYSDMTSSEGQKNFTRLDESKSNKSTLVESDILVIRSKLKNDINKLKNAVTNGTLSFDFNIMMNMFSNLKEKYQKKTSGLDRNVVNNMLNDFETWIKNYNSIGENKVISFTKKKMVENILKKKLNEDIEQDGEKDDRRPPKIGKYNAIDFIKDYKNFSNGDDEYWVDVYLDNDGDKYFTLLTGYGVDKFYLDYEPKFDIKKLKLYNEPKKIIKPNLKEWNNRCQKKFS